MSKSPGSRYRNLQEFAKHCGWLVDKFGLSWQIVPAALQEMLKSSDGEKSQSVMKALMQMGKLDVAALRRAFEDA